MLATSGALAGLLHPLAEAERPHVGPDLVDVLEAFALAARLADGSPARRDLPVDRPDRVLLLVIHHHLVDPLVVLVVSHSTSPCCCRHSDIRSAAAPAPRPDPRASSSDESRAHPRPGRRLRRSPPIRASGPDPTR